MAVKPHMDRVFALTLLAGSGLSFTQEPVCANETSTFWYDGDRARLIYPTRDQRVFFTITKNNQKNQIDRDLFTQNNPDHTILNETEYSIRYRSSNIQTEPATVTPPIDLYGHPVFHQSIDSEEDLLLSTGQIIVHFREPTPKDKAQNWGETHILELEQPLTTPNTFLFRCPSQDGCIEAANQSYADPKVRFAYPNWLRPRISRDLAVNLGNDTYFSYLWHLENFGQTGGIPREDIHAQSAWQNNHSSSNTVIGVVDDGLEIAHEDIIENNQATLNWDFLSNDSDPTGGTHGTAVAGLAAARGGNNIGISGVAPHAAIAGIRLIGATTDTNETAALTLHKDAIDIYNNSWGPHDLGNLDGPAPLTQAALLDGVTYGRNGLGAIYVWAAGNGRVTNDNANYDGYANNPYTIAVSATNSHGKLTYYSEPGACILVNAPGGDYTSWMATTDRTGLAGYNVGNYTFNFGGTSASVPVVSGVIALMLDANPNLSWRDIKQILAETAEKNDPSHAGWVKNGAGYWVNHDYGFGRVNADFAVSQSITHSNLPPQVIVEHTDSPRARIPDSDQTGITIEIDVSEDIKTEFVQLTLDSDHSYWGDLEITLISPHGTESILAKTHNSSGAQLLGGWAFGSELHRGESSRGKWLLTITDRAAIDTGQILHWKLQLFGYNARLLETVRSIPTLSNNGLAFAALLVLISVIRFRRNHP